MIKKKRGQTRLTVTGVQTCALPILLKVPPFNVTVALLGSWLAPSKLRVPPVIVTSPPTALTPAVFANIRVPALTVVRPVYVFAPVPPKFSVPSPVLLTPPLESTPVINRSVGAAPLLISKFVETPPKFKGPLIVAVPLLVLSKATLPPPERLIALAMVTSLMEREEMSRLAPPVDRVPA